MSDILSEEEHSHALGRFHDAAKPVGVDRAALVRHDDRLRRQVASLTAELVVAREQAEKLAYALDRIVGMANQHTLQELNIATDALHEYRGSQCARCSQRPESSLPSPGGTSSTRGGGER